MIMFDTEPATKLSKRKRARATTPPARPRIGAGGGRQRDGISGKKAIGKEESGKIARVERGWKREQRLS